MLNVKHDGSYKYQRFKSLILLDEGIEHCKGWTDPITRVTPGIHGPQSGSR